MSLSTVSSPNSQVSRSSSFKKPLVVREFEEEILEIFLDKTAFLFGILSNRKEGTLEKRVTFLPLQPVLPEQIEALQKLLSPERSFLRLKDSNVIQIEPKMLGGGIQTEMDPEVKTARELFLKLSAITQKNIAELKQREIFDKISILSKALPSLSNYRDSLDDAWYVAKVLHMAVDVLLLTIWGKEKEDSQNTRYSFEQKKAILKPIRNAKKILEKHIFPMKEATLLSLDLTDTGIQLLPESDMKAKDWKAFIRIGEALNSSFIVADLNESDTSQKVSKLLAELWFSLRGYWTVSPNLYGDSILARILPLKENFQALHLIKSLKCSLFDETLTHTDSEEDADFVSRQLLAFDRLTNLSLYELKEGLREEAFRRICIWPGSKNETLKKSAILSLKQISLLSKDTLIRKDALEALDKISLNQEEGYSLFSYQKWVIDNLPKGYLDEENLKIEQALEMARDRSSLDIIKRLSFCAADESIPPLILEDEFVPFRSTLQKIVDLGLIEVNNGTYKISKKTQDKLKKLIYKGDERENEALLGLTRSLNRAWNFDKTNLNTLTDPQENILPHIESFVENILKEDKTSDPLLVASIDFLKKLGLYQLLVKKDLQKTLNSLKPISKLEFLIQKAKGKASQFVPSIIYEDIETELLFTVCHFLDKTQSELCLSDKLGANDIRFLVALTKAWNISSLIIGQLYEGAIEVLASEIQHSELLKLELSPDGIKPEEAKALAAALPFSKLTSLDLYSYHVEGAIALAAALPNSQLTHLGLVSGHNEEEALNKEDNRLAKALAAALPSSKLTSLDLALASNLTGNEGAIALAAALPFSKLINLDLSNNKIGDEGAKALATALPTSQLANLDLNSNRIGDKGAQALAAALPASRLANLDLNSNRIKAEGAIALAAALPSSKLTNLNLWDNIIGDEGAKALASALPKSQLNKLNLRSNQIGDEGAKAIAITLPKSQISKLNLEENQIGNEGVKTLAASLPDSQLIDLDLGSNHNDEEEEDNEEIGNQKAIALASALPKSQLNKLNLRSNQIGDEGAKALAAALPSSKLTNLNLWDNIISDEGAIALASALPKSQLNKLNLRSNRIGDEGAKDIAITLPKSQISELNLAGNQITAEGAKAFAESRKLTKVKL